MGFESFPQYALPLLEPFPGDAIMDIQGGHPSQAAVMVHRVVPVEEVDRH
jgi:hypothetical protein